VTAGAVSQQVKRLEMSLGIALFRRLPQGLLLTPEGAAYLPDVSRAFDLLTDATEAVAPSLNGRKLSVGLDPLLANRLPKGWPRHSGELEPYIRETQTTDDVELIWSNDLDALLLARQTRHVGLNERAIYSNGEPEPFYFVTRPGLAECRQSRAIEALSARA